MKKVMVISLGGSLIVPKEIDFKFLHKFKKTLRKNYTNYKFVVVCGGGVIARKYISVLAKEGKPKKQIALAGIRATRTNAQFMMQLFGKEANQKLPKNMKEVKDNLKKNKVVFCGALRYDPKATSDSTTAQLAHYFKSKFINMTNVKGLYNDNPKKNPKAKFIPHESWKDFQKRVNKIKFKAGQNFVLDQTASAIIYKHKIPTYIIGSNRSLNKILKGKKFTGTLIEG
jgi:uridylate kinase